MKSNIFISNLKIFANHGCFDYEKQNGQEFFIDATLFVDFEQASKTDSLQNTIDYGKVCDHIKKFATANTFNLIETLSERLCTSLLTSFEKLEKVEITIKKPNAPVNADFENIMTNCTKQWHTAFLGLGSNLGNREDYLASAFETIENSKECKLLKKSAIIETKPFGKTDQPDFLNACVKIETLFSPSQLLNFCQSIENNAGRERKEKWGARTLDMDILLFDNAIIQTDRLIVPHPEMHLRKFVLEPLCQIEPYALHSLKLSSVKELLEKL